jgi:predicted O-methyltransferase YrrM
MRRHPCRRTGEDKLFEKGKYEKVGWSLVKKLPNFQKKYNSLSTKSQISFLMGLINDYHFSNGDSINNVLEIGVFHGVTSLYMLKEGCKRNQFTLYGIDLGRDTDFFGGAVFNETSKEEIQHYHLNRGHTSFDIEDVIPHGIKLDMVFIDAGHSHPHPIIDLIHVIPFLHNESIVMLHDVVDYMRPNAWGESFIYTGWTENKYRSFELDTLGNPVCESTLGCIKIPEDKQSLYSNIMQIVKIPFRAAPWKFDDYFLGINEESIVRLKSFITKYYSDDFSKSVCDCMMRNLQDYKENWLLYVHETRFFNYLFERQYAGRYDHLLFLRIINNIENILRKIKHVFIKNESKVYRRPNEL